MLIQFLIVIAWISYHFDTYGKENNDEDVKESTSYCLVTLAVVTSAVRGTIILSVVHVRCSL